MKKTKFQIFILVLIIGTFPTFQSCSKDSSNLSPSAAFTFNPNGGYAPCAIQFNSTSQNANDFTWDFGDGSTSIAENPSHTYNFPGTYTVTLKVKNGNLQNQTSSQIIIQRPFTKANLVKVVLNKMPFLDPSGASWDLLDGPDLYFQLLSPNPNNTVLSSSGTITNLSESMLPVNWDLNSPFTITNFTDFYFIQLMDYDPLDIDDKIDYVSFKLDPYTTGPDAFPTYITRSQNNSTVTLYFNWTY